VVRPHHHATRTEAQVSQRPVCVHGLKHLGTTDRGISMFRQGIRAVKADSDPAALFRDAGAVIPTYCNDTIVRVPPARTPELDTKLMRETRRRLAEGYIEQSPLIAGLGSPAGVERAAPG
jgi:hypothetical protein